MRVILGVDPGGQYLNCLRLLARMNFAALSLLMIHVRSNDEETDDNLMVHAARHADALGLSAHAYSELGHPAEVLSRMASLENADLIAIGSGEKGALHALLRGSVGRSLMNKWTGSLLIAKGKVEQSGPIDSVMGFDGGSQAQESIGRLAAWNPAGVRHIEVVSVETPLTADFELMRVQQGRVFGQATTFDVETIDQVAERGAKLLQEAGFKSSSLGVVGDVVEELRRAMMSSRSELFILPAETHGLIERAFFGSTSLAEVLGGHHSMLVIR